MLYLDGVYDKQGVFYPVKSPTYQDIECITQKIAERVSRYLEKAGYLIPQVPLQSCLCRCVDEFHQKYNPGDREV
jgi:hypothetical protein